MLLHDHTEEVGEHAPAEFPPVPDYLIERLDLAEIGKLCGRMADLPSDRWTGLLVTPSDSLPPLPTPS